MWIGIWQWQVFGRAPLPVVSREGEIQIATAGEATVILGSDSAGARQDIP